MKPIKTMINLAVLGLMTNASYAGGFSLYTESSPAAIGNFAAGIAAEAADASTGWYNPAGLTLINQPQVVFGGVGVFPSSKLTGSSQYNTPLTPTPYVRSYSNMNGAEDAFVPAFHYALPLNERITLGLSLVSPFGLSTKWGRQDPVRYAATFSELLTTNLSPEIGAKINENFALGAGLDIQYARVKFNSVLGSPALLQAYAQLPFGITPTALDSYSYNKGDSYGVGFHVGGLFMFNESHTRLGLNYQSKMRHKFQGHSRLTGALATPGLTPLNPVSIPDANPSAVYWSNSLFSNHIEFPDVITLSGYHTVDEKLALLGSVVYTGWNSFKTIQLNNVAAYDSAKMQQTQINSTSTQNYKNAWRFAVGANYQLNEQWMLRVGGGYDETPTNNADRDVRLPDSDRWALSLGTHYQWRPDLGVDVGWTHLWAENTTINKTIPLGTSEFTVNARGKAHADLVGAQLTWTMDKVEGPISK